MNELINAAITVNLLPSNYSLHPDEENAIDKVVRAAINYNALSRTQPENKLSVRGKCAHMQLVEGGIPYCEEKQTACNGCTGQESKPLSLEELRLMVNLWVWAESDTWNGKHYSGWGKIIQVFPIVSVKIIEESPGYITEYDIGRHEAKFYAHKPEQEEKQNG